MKTIKLTNNEWQLLLHIVELWEVDEGNYRPTREVNAEKKLLNLLYNKIIRC
jgi:hypothetical protein